MERSRRPLAVTANHLSRKALVYLRQSTMEQVRSNDGSTIHQRTQAEYARDWGWPPEAIEIIDEDLGRSGSSTIHRTGFRRMEEMVEAGDLGAIFASNLGRLGRNLAETIRLVEKCKTHNVLLVDNGRVRDVRDKSDRLLATILLNVAEFENDVRREALYYGRLVKAQRGIAVSPPPAGYVSQAGMWLKDPDETVRHAIEEIFATYAEERSLIRTVAKLRSAGLRLPRRRGHVVYWKEPDVGSVGFMIRSRAYVGDYVFRKRRVDPALGRSPNGRLRDRVAEQDELVTCVDHHEPYLDRVSWERLQQYMDLNAARRHRRNLGPGPALLQGILKCGQHDNGGYAFSARYKTLGGGGQLHYYVCQGDRWKGGDDCGSAPSRPIEDVVVRMVEDRLDAPSINLVRNEWRRERAQADRERRRQEMVLEQARKDVRDLERRYLQVDSANRLVAADIESKLEKSKRTLQALERSSSGTQDVIIDLTEADFEEMLTLAARFRELWDAPTTTSLDRKQIVRAMIDRVVVESRTAEEIEFRIEWADKTPPSHCVADLHPKTLRRIQEMHASGIPAREIAQHLVSQGVPPSRRGATWTEVAIKQAVYRHQRRCKGKA